MGIEELNNIQLEVNKEKTQEIPLKDIDHVVIKGIRILHKRNNADYLQLKKAIEKDGQNQPIIIRKLTDEEKKNARKNAIYGIIDGHHRFAIAKDLKKEKILAVVDNGTSSGVRDTILAMRFNLSSIKMSSKDKGKVINDLLESLGDSSNQELIEEIGEKTFGLKKSMTYRCLQIYRKSIGKETVNKPRHNSVNVQEIRDLMNNLPEDVSNISKDDGLKYLENIKSIEQQLKFLKKSISNLESVQEAIKEQKQARIKLAREKKND